MDRFVNLGLIPGTFFNTPYPNDPKRGLGKSH